MVKKYFSKTRTFQLLSIIILSPTIIYQFLSLQSESNIVRLEQTDKFSYSLTNLAAAEASRYISEKKTKELQLLIDSLSRDPVIKDATIYDQFGKKIYQSKEALPLLTLLKIDGDTTQAEGVIPYIAELYVKNKKIGYIRISLEQNKVLSLMEDYEEHGLAVLIILIILSFITGIIFMAMFYKRAEIIYQLFQLKRPFIMQNVKDNISKLIKSAAHK
jgi:membrane protein